MDTLTQLDIRAIAGLGLAFIIVAGAAGYFIRRAAGSPKRPDSGGGRRSDRLR